MDTALQFQKKAERQVIVDYQPGFQLDVPKLDHLSRWSELEATSNDFLDSLGRPSGLRSLASLISREGIPHLETLAQRAHTATIARFGKTMRLFAPLYLSNECVSECTYCGFQVWNKDIVRRTLSPSEVQAEARYLKSLGLRHLLLVAGEHPKHVSVDYISSCISAVASVVPGVSVEVQSFDVAGYAQFVEAGCDGLVIYQECYDSRVYGDYHLKGNKRFFDWRLGSPERAAEAGMRSIGIGTLVGLNENWRFEVLALAAHAMYLHRRFPHLELTVALPRLERAAGYEDVAHAMSDRELACAIAALRLVLPNCGIVLSTREGSSLRDGLMKLGVTTMSAQSTTEPGGYLSPGESGEQFEVSDHRTVGQVVAHLSNEDYEPVMTDASVAARHVDRGKLVE